MATMLLMGAHDALAQDSGAVPLKASGESSFSKIAPGESLPISIKLTNFGAKSRIDVIVNYKITDANGKTVTAATETVAVETTASFIKQIQLPSDLPAGVYDAEVDLIYEGQAAPAVSKFQFIVEKKIAGIFQSDFLFYGGATLLISIVFGVAGNIFAKRRRLGRLELYDYSNVPKAERLYFEIVSDIITQMRLRVGDRAIALAEHIDGLTLETNSGQVVRITNDPAKVIALLIFRYEKNFGKKVSFRLRKRDETAKKNVEPVEKNLVVIRKYFE